MTDDGLTDAEIEDTAHCTVCQAAFVVGSNEPYVLLDPPGDFLRAYEWGCQQVALCPECALKATWEFLDGCLTGGVTEVIPITDRAVVIEVARSSDGKIEAVVKRASEASGETEVADASAECDGHEQNRASENRCATVRQSASDQRCESEE